MRDHRSNRGGWNCYGDECARLVHEGASTSLIWALQAYALLTTSAARGAVRDLIQISGRGK